jgi:3-mercaptopyruvate sulfurtransferase SseA
LFSADRPYDMLADRQRLIGHIPGAPSRPTKNLLDVGRLLLDTVHIGQLCDAVGLRPATRSPSTAASTTQHTGVARTARAARLARRPPLHRGWSEYGSLTDIPVAQRTGTPTTDETDAEPA